MVDYKEKLLQDKIDSMNQNDRLEYYSISSIGESISGSDSVTIFIFLISTLFMLLFSMFLILSDDIFFIFGVIVFLLSFLFYIFSFVIFISLLKQKKKYNKRLEEILERRTNKK